MIEKCTGKITDWLVKCDVVKEADRELYKYAVYSIFLTLAPVLLAIGIGSLFGDAGRSILIILPFVIIRKFSGGYHTKKVWTCLICSSLLLILCVALSFRINCSRILIGITAGASVSLACFSPIGHENRLLSREERSRYKRITAAIAANFILVDLLLFWFHQYTYVICVSIGIILSAGLQLPCILRGLFLNCKMRFLLERDR